MIRQEISKQIWNLKYRNNDETEEQYYERIPTGLFKDLTLDQKVILSDIVGVKDIHKFTYESLKDHLLSLAGRGMYAVGTDIKNQTFSNCFVIPFRKDSMAAIMDTAKEAALTMKAGGGVGYSLSILRPKSSIIKTTGSNSSGAVHFLKILDSTCSVIKAGNSRRGAQLAAIGIWHPSVIDFITAKRSGDLSNFNLSVFVSDKFMKAIENDEDWNLEFPDTSFEKYDEEWDGILERWKEKGYPVEIHQTLKARELWDMITESNYKFAEPGILFEDTINERNTLAYCEYIHTCNPCGEQPLAWYGSCNLGPINLSNHVKNAFSDTAYFDYETYEKTIKLMVILLDKMLDVSYYPLKEQKDEVDKKRLIGMGFTGLADAMSKLKIPYNSPEAIEFTENITRLMSIIGYDTSAELAKEFGSFPYYSDKMLDSYNVKMLSEEVREKIKKYGLRNSRITSIAPTGTTSLVFNNTSAGIEPNFALEYNRTIKNDDGSTMQETIETDAWNLYKNSEYYDGTVPDFFITAQDLEIKDHINIQAAAQKWIDTAISKTTNVPVDYPLEDFKNIYMTAWKKGLKGCTTYRPNSILGSVLEVKKEEKEEHKDAKKELKEYFNIWKEQEKGEVIHDNVELPSEYPMKGWKMTSEGRKWYVNVAFKDKKCERPFAIFVNTNAREDSVNTYDAIEKLISLANRKGINKTLIQKNTNKCASQDNVNKICRTVGLLLRHNVKIIDIIKTLDSLDVPISSFIFRLKKFLMMFIEEIPANGTPCPECGAPVTYRDGCQSCTECFWSKCA